MDFTVFRYQPGDFSWDPSIEEYMVSVYKDILSGNKDNDFRFIVKDKISTLHFLFKQAAVNGDLSDSKASELQDYFWGLLYERFDVC